MAERRCDVIIPTYDNLEMLYNCVTAIIGYSYECPMRVIIVNNGKHQLEHILHGDRITILDPGENLGWEGGLKLGLEHSDSKYVVFANDDIYIPRASSRWAKNMIREIELYDNLGAVGPSSNVVMGMQNMGNSFWGRIAPTSYLIGFCMMLKREALEKAGGIQPMEHGGDDIDLSIRLRKVGYKLIILNDCFIFHYGFQTGEKVKGGPEKAGGWNSREMTDLTNKELIQKHGFMEYWNTMKNIEFHEFMGDIHAEEGTEFVDAESIAIKQFINGEDKILELGCGSMKTVPNAIGIDKTPKGEVSFQVKKPSVTDIVADVSEPLPFDKDFADMIIARHILEHVIDPIQTMENWKKVLRPKGKLVISAPDERADDGIPLNPEHKHAYTPDSLAVLGRMMGFKEIGRADNYNGMSFTICLEKQ